MRREGKMVAIAHAVEPRGHEVPTAAAEPSVLVADDDESMRLLLGSVLAGAGYRVTCVADGAEAIEKLGECPPDLMILDLLMPGTSGWDVLAFLENHPSLAGVPVVVLTSYGDAERPTGRPVIHKPVDGELLRHLVGELLAQARCQEPEGPRTLLPGSRRLPPRDPG